MMIIKLLNLKNLLIVAVFTALAIAGCTPKRAVKTDLTWETKLTDRKVGPCPSKSEKCMTMKAEYPVFSTSDQEFQKMLNVSVMRFVLPQFNYSGQGDADTMSIESAFNAMENDFNMLLRAEPQHSNGWFTEVHVTPELVLDGKFLNMKSTVSSFLGGAHPNSFLQLRVHDVVGKKEVAWQDLVTDTAALLGLAETKFLKLKNLKAGVNFESEGYWFPGNQFWLPDNFAITNEGFYFFYNAYEVASYAEGTTEISLTFEEAAAVLAPSLKKGA